MDSSVVNPNAALHSQKPLEQLLVAVKEIRDSTDAPEVCPNEAATDGQEQQVMTGNSRCSSSPPSESSAAGQLTSAARGLGTIPRQGERISLTIRRVLKVHTALGIFRK